VRSVVLFILLATSTAAFARRCHLLMSLTLSQLPIWP
jgi:hypothetical protein